jgi:tyrosine-protein kinase
MMGTHSSQLVRVKEDKHLSREKAYHKYFYFIEGGQVTHGLDELIRHYQGPNSINDDDILLQKGIIKSSLPPDSRRHGRTNLLHRATKEGN